MANCIICDHRPRFETRLDCGSAECHAAIWLMPTDRLNAIRELEALAAWREVAPLLCGQDGCQEPAIYLFTWPGQDEAGICEQHAGRLRAIADAMGLHLQLIPLPAEPTPAAGSGV